MQSVVRSAAAVRHARRFLLAIEPISLRSGIFSGFGSPWWTQSGRTFCCGPHHQGDLRSVTGDSNVMEEGNFSGTVKKETLTTNNNNEMKADEAALFSSFEKWMAEYGKVYRNETEKGWRFQTFRATVGKVEYYKEKYGEGACVLNEFAAEFPGEWFARCRGYTLLPHPLGDSNVKEGNSAGMGKKKMRTNNKGAGKMTLRKWFEHWMAEYGKVYPNEAEKALRFKYFKKTVRTGKYYNERYKEGEFVLNEFAAESPKEWLIRSQHCTLSPHVIDQLDPVVREVFGIRKVI